MCTAAGVGKTQVRIGTLDIQQGALNTWSKRTVYLNDRFLGLQKQITKPNNEPVKSKHYPLQSIVRATLTHLKNGKNRERCGIRVVLHVQRGLENATWQVWKPRKEKSVIFRASCEDEALQWVAAINTQISKLTSKLLATNNIETLPSQNYSISRKQASSRKYSMSQLDSKPQSKRSVKVESVATSELQRDREINTLNVLSNRKMRKSFTHLTWKVMCNIALFITTLATYVPNKLKSVAKARRKEIVHELVEDRSKTNQHNHRIPMDSKNDVNMTYKVTTA